MAGTDDNPIIYPRLEMPDNVSREKITIWSRGIALDGDIYRPIGLSADSAVPGVVLSHGIGGDKLTPERYAARFASSGMIALTFTHASWGDSHGQLIAAEPAEPLQAGAETVTRVREIRNLLDPLEWVDSYRSALDYLEGESNVDTDRIGAWGTSFGGGTALYTAAIDDRVKVLAIQVPAVLNAPELLAQAGRQRAIQIARGEFGPVPQSDDVLPGLKGTPHFARFAQYKVGDKVDEVTVPTLILDAANEEMFDTAESGARAYRILKERGIETYYEVLPDIDHYGIYFGGYERGSSLAHDWFAKHL
ncbi:MAG: prolyl oligopeptidase family serine peptidase [Pseudomonadota bacterium]